MFDTYTVKARLYPIIILFFPIIIVGLFYSLEFQSLIHLGTSIGVVGALTYLFSQLGRDSGKKKEPNLWQSWGGTPSVQLLRLRDERIDKHTTQRYHQKLQMLCPVPMSPDGDLEINDPNRADEIYKAWTKYLISQTRDTSKYPLILKELTNYGFRRNLWGLKSLALLLITVISVSTYIFGAIQTNSWNPIYFGHPFQYTAMALLLLLTFWLFIVTKNWVRVTAFSYAERLCEAAESI